MPPRAVLGPLALALLSSGFLLAQDPRLPLLEKLAGDPSPAVRLEAVRALARIPEARAAEIALGVLEQPMDGSLDYALWLTMNQLAEPWIAALESGAWKPEGRERQLEFALKSIPPTQASRVLSRLLSSRPLDPSGSGPWIEVIGQAGGPRELGLLLAAVNNAQLQPSATVRAIQSLAGAVRLRKLRTEGDSAALPRLLQHADSSVRQAAANWAGSLKDPALVQKIGELASNDASASVRSAAFQALRQIGGPQALGLLKSEAYKASPESRPEALSALAALDSNAAIAPLIDFLPSVREDASAVALWRGVLAQKSLAKPLAEALKTKASASPGFVSETAARAGMRVAREGGRNEVELVVALAAAAGLANDPQTLTASLVKDIASRAQQSGDPARGEAIYRRDTLGCVGCHAIGGAGGKVGPDMTSIGASAPADYLVESLLMPNAKIKEGYHSVAVTTRDGSEFVGTLARENPTELVLRNAAGAEQVIAKNEISKREQSTQSIMPSGLVDPLSEQEQLDLVAFLSQLGKPGDYDASKGGVARRWHVALVVHTDAQSGQDSWPLSKPFNDKRWVHTSAYVRGAIPRSVLEDITRSQPWTGRLAIYAATEIQVAAQGTARFNLLAPASAELWIDERKAGASGMTRVDLAPGRHRVLVKLDPKQFPDWLRLESPDVAFLLE